uniref:Uncharacterized protein n=1 Tax=Trypanosoma vivax (strain Y486) TaxID=1055687 RepID=G0U7N5_TRYVY|nr:hypothetical protein TVY486_1009380 [Trypanosoma vivax Y486]
MPLFFAMRPLRCLSAAQKTLLERRRKRAFLFGSLPRSSWLSSRSFSGGSVPFPSLAYLFERLCAKKVSTGWVGALPLGPAGSLKIFEALVLFSLAVSLPSRAWAFAVPSPWRNARRVAKRF